MRLQISNPSKPTTTQCVVGAVRSVAPRKNRTKHKKKLIKHSRPNKCKRPQVTPHSDENQTERKAGRQASKQAHTDTEIAHSFNLTLQPAPPQQVEHQSRIPLPDSSLKMQAFHPSHHSSRISQSASHAPNPAHTGKCRIIPDSTHGWMSTNSLHKRPDELRNQISPIHS